MIPRDPEINRFVCTYTSPQNLVRTSHSGTGWEELRLGQWAWFREAAKFAMTGSLGFCEGLCPQKQRHSFSEVVD